MATLTRCCLAWAFTLSAALACREKAPAPAPVPASSAAVLKKPVDRLGPGELAPGDSEIFGLGLPRGMFVEGKFRDFAVAVGKLPADAVTNYVRDEVAAAHVEIAAAGTVFPSVRIKKGAPERTYRIEIVQDGLMTRLVVRDITPPPQPKIGGASPEELWRRAGFTRDGKPLDPKALK